MENIDTLGMDQIKFLWSVYRDLRNRTEGTRGVVMDEDAHVSSYNEFKEDVREVVFGVRRDGKLKGLRSIRDIRI